MRLEVLAREVMPGDLIWFSNDRRPAEVVEASVQDGAERLVVLKSVNNQIWYMKHDTATVYRYEPDPPEVDPDAPVFEDPDGNPA